MKPLSKVFCAAFLLAASSAVLAAGDAARGRLLYEKLCVACHSIDYNGVGPAHRGVFGRKAASRPDYIYSPALAAANIVWDEKTLGRWLAAPEKFVPGQKMGFALPAAKDRRDIIAYLKTQSAAPS